MQPYDSDVENQMLSLYRSLNEKDRRRDAASMHRQSLLNALRCHAGLSCLCRKDGGRYIQGAASSRRKS